MSRRNKLGKFADLTKYRNVFQNIKHTEPWLTNCEGAAIHWAGKWRNEYFGNQNPITLELACGRGEYTLALAQMFPDINFIGIDIKGARIWKGATMALKAELKNVAFLRTRIELINHYFGHEEIDEIWITFPDPFLKNSKSNRRLSSPTFLRLYRKIIMDGGILHLKTDSDKLFHYTLNCWKELSLDIDHINKDIYSDPYRDPLLNIKTYYEQKHLEDEKTIKYIRCRLRTEDMSRSSI